MSSESQESNSDYSTSETSSEIQEMPVELEPTTAQEKSLDPVLGDPGETRTTDVSINYSSSEEVLESRTLLFFSQFERLFRVLPAKIKRKIGKILEHLPISRPITKDAIHVIPDPFFKRSADKKLISSFVDCHSNFLSDSGIHPRNRFMMIELLIQVQLNMGLRDSVLHAAVSLLDLYTNYRKIQEKDYPALGFASIDVAQKMADSESEINYARLCSIYEIDSILPTIELLKGNLMNFLKEIDGLPTGLTFLEIHMTGFVGVPADELRWIKNASVFLLELGLHRDFLSTCSANLRCAAVLFLVILILRYPSCCSESNSHGGDLCTYNEFEPWPDLLWKLTHVENDQELWSVAMFYGLCLNFNPLPENTVLESDMTYRKFSTPTYGSIALDPKLKRFTEKDLMAVFIDIQQRR